MTRPWLPLALAVIACGGPQRTQPAGPGAVVKTYPALAFKVDAKASGLAVILGTDDADRATVLTLAPHPVTVDAVSMAGVSPIELAVTPNADGTPKVAGELGSAWLAAVAAAMALDKDLTDLAFAAHAHGKVDGRSASGLLAAGFVAAAIGAPIEPTTTLWGALGPDGTLGPVDELPEAFATALDKGKKRLGYPAGMRRTKSLDGKDVDLVELAKSRGAEAVELVDVRDAYRLLTGRTLPAPVPVAEADMAIDPATSKLLEARYRTWQQQLATVWATIVQLDTAGVQPRLLIGLRNRAKSDGEAAEQLHKQGKVAAAYAKVLAAAALASTVHRAYDVVLKVQAGDVAAAIAALAPVDPASVRAAFDQIHAAQPSTIGGFIDVAAAFQTALRGWAFQTSAADRIAEASAYLKSLEGKPRAELGSHEIAEAVVEHVVPALALAEQTSAETTLAARELEFATPVTPRYTISAAELLRLATASQVIANTELQAFDAMLIAPLAEKSHLAEDETRRRFAAIEPDYLTALAAMQLGDAAGVPYEIKAAWGDHSSGWALVSLAGGQLAALDAALVIAKYISIGLASDEHGTVTGVAHEAAFAQLLVAAEREARASARAARAATGAIPTHAKLAYELAMVERTGDATDRLEALGELWAVTAMSRTAVMLARN